MAASSKKFRVADETPREFPRLTCFTVMQQKGDGWAYYLVDHMPVSRKTLPEAQALADRLERGEDISEDQKRGPGTKWWRPR